jgi:hypothetical protein
MDDKFYTNKSNNNINICKDFDERIAKFQKTMETR